MELQQWQISRINAFSWKNKPIKAIQDLLNRPIGLSPTGIATEDSKTALSIAVMLSQNGMLGGYFTENNKKNALFGVLQLEKLMQENNLKQY